MEDSFNALLQYSTAGDRICPQPPKWNKFWQLLGSPHKHVAPPLILSGWAFSTDREKRERFKGHIEFAADNGLLAEADSFIRSLSEHDWHTCPDHHLDWSYGQALIEDEKRKRRAIRAASTHYQALRRVSDADAFNKEHLPQTLLLFHLLFPTGHEQSLLEALHQATEQFSSSAKGEFSLLDDVPSSIATTLEELDRAKRVELLLLQILACMKEGGTSLDRDSIGDFVREVVQLPDQTTLSLDL